MIRRALLLVLLLLPTAACSSTASPRLEKLYELSLEDPGDAADRRALASLGRRRLEWAGEVREMHAEGKLKTDRDLLIAATLLLDSPELDDLDLARDLALEAAERGDDRGFPLAAEAIDHGLMLRGEPQRYGTQYVDVPGYGWTLYRWDPLTTDVEREAMGVPPIAVALERLKLLNGVEDVPGTGLDASAAPSEN